LENRNGPPSEVTDMPTVAGRSRLLIFVSFWLMLLLGPVTGQQQSALLLYKGSEEGVSASRVATRVEPILKSMGFKTTYHDIEQGLPPSDSVDLILSWYASAKIQDPEAYIDWMAQQIASGKKVVVLGNFGAHTADGSTWMTNESLNRFFYPFGLSYGAAYTGDTNVLSVTTQQAPAKAPSPLNYYLLFSSVNPANKIFMEVQRSDLPNSKSALVVQTPYGGMAQETYVDNLDLQAFLTSIVQAKKQIAARDKKLLGLYKSSENVDQNNNFLARFVAPILFDLGYGIDYHDIDSGLPASERMSAYDGIISWYTTPELAKAGDYIEWLTAQLDADRRVIILGNFGAFAEDVPSKAGDVRRFLQSPEYNTFFFPFGLEFRGAWTPEKKKVQVAKKDASVMNWLEPGHVGHYYWIRSMHPDNQEYLTVTRDDLQDGESAVVVATPKGGLALESYILGTDPTTKQPRMHLDMEKFLSQALTLQGETVTDLRPDLDELQPKPPLPPLPLPVIGGDGQYPADVTPEKRKILAFYQSSINESPIVNSTFLSAQMVLEHLGLVVQYHDLDDPNLPSMEQMKDFRGILLWLSSGAIPEARKFDAWLQENVAQGRKLVLMGDYEIREKTTLSLVPPQKLYAALGLHYDPIGNAPLITTVKRGGTFQKATPQNPTVVRELPGVMGFEREIEWDDPDLKNNWHLVRSIWPESEVGFSVQQAQGISDIVTVTKTGGAAIGPFTLYDKGKERKTMVESAAEKERTTAKADDIGGQPWRLNPFRFFAKAYDVETMARPDFTTLNGSRIYYSHIDGDAFGGMSLIDRSSLNGEMMYKRVLKSLPLPVTVSYVTRDIEAKIDDRYSRELAVAQEIFKLPNVEAASHTFSHPFDWKKGDLALANDPDKPYKLVRTDVDLAKEIEHSIEFVDKLCPEGKRCEILLWSGRCNPNPNALELVRTKGLYNMNGAESTLDTKFPYIAGLLPLFGDVGKETQFHVSAAGDFYYTQSWTGDYDGMKNLPDYFARTESPRRLRCLNVYYHFYLAEREPGIQGLEVAYADALDRSPAPMFASEYAEVLADALRTKIGLDSSGRFWMSNNGVLRTMRIDKEDRYPDFASSQGIIGFNRANDDLYVHLDGSGEARVTLTETPPKVPYLERFTHRIKDWKASEAGVSFVASGQGPAHLTIRNLKPSSEYRIESDSEEASVRTDAQGTLVWTGRFDGYRTSHPMTIRKATP
jgi:polysaccharide biosynthesis protein PelA